MNIIRNLCFIFCIAFSISANADDCIRYVDGVFNYSICLPQKWNKTYRDMGERHILGSKQKSGAEINVTASQFGDDEQLKWDSWMNSYVRKSKRDFRSIIETKEIQAGTDTAIKLIVFDYSSGMGRMLQRTMLMKHDDKLLVVECRAPVRSFGKYTDLFNTVMSSVDLTGSLEGESVETLKVAEAGPRKQPAIKKETAREKREEKKAAASKTLEKKVKPEKKPVLSEETEPSRKTIKPEKVKPDIKVVKPEKAKPETETRQTEETKPFTDKAVDPETKKLIENELKKIRDLEQKGIIEKMDDR
jgi:hypothetical protein